MSKELLEMAALLFCVWTDAKQIEIHSCARLMIIGKDLIVSLPHKIEADEYFNICISRDDCREYIKKIRKALK